MEPLNADDAQRYAEFKEWTPYEAALLLAGCKPLPRSHIPEPSANTSPFNLIHAVQICGPSRDLKTPHPPEVWMRWYSEHLAGRDFPDFSQPVMRAMERIMDGKALQIFAQSVLITPKVDVPESVELPNELSGKKVAAVKIDRGLIIKKAALIKKHGSRWSTIERDFQDASENGLSKMAKADKHGYWFESDALKWAEQQGKIFLTETHPALATPFPSTIHRIKG
jgi:hypothetical protein